MFTNILDGEELTRSLETYLNIVPHRLSLALHHKMGH